MHETYKKLAIVCEHNGNVHGIPIDLETTAADMQRVVNKRGASVLRILDRRYDQKHKDTIMNAWLNGASKQQLWHILINA